MIIIIKEQLIIMNEKCTFENLSEKIDDLNPCEGCHDIQIKKFTPIKDFADYDKLDNDYGRCSCGKRPLDVVMSHILKIMVEEGIVSEKANLRRNSPIPLPAFCFSSLNPQFIGKDSLILIHSDFDKEVANRIFNEVLEVKGVLKGDVSKTIGIFDKDSNEETYEILAGDDSRCDVLRTLIKKDDKLVKIIINKFQSVNHIEVASTTEEKLLKVYNYLENNDVDKIIAIDGMCGSGAIGIFLMHYGFEKVIFNDINPKLVEITKDNIITNNIDGNYEILNCAFEDLDMTGLDLCIIDMYPGANIEKIKEKANKIANDVLII